MNHNILYVLLIVYSYVIASGICGYVLWTLRDSNSSNELLELVSAVEWIVCISGIIEFIVLVAHHLIHPAVHPSWVLPVWIGMKVWVSGFQWYFALFILRARK